MSIGLRHMAAGAFYFSVMTLMVRIAGQTIPIPEMLLVRSVVVLLISSMALKRQGLTPRGVHHPLLVVRSLFGFSAMACFYYAITHLPMADVTVIHYTNPVFAALLAAWYLQERVVRTEVVRTVAALAGVVLVAQPTALFGGLAMGHDPVAVGAALAGALLSAAAYVVVRKLGRSDHPLVVVWWFALVSTLLTLPVLTVRFVMPSGGEWGVLIGLGVATYLGQISITRGLHLERAGPATAVGYLQIVFAAGWGLLFFGEVPGLLSLAGAALIVASTLRLGRPVNGS